MISVLYLLFIAISIINIPIDWLHINKYVAPLLTETTVVSIDNKDLRAVYESVEQTKADFYTAIGYDEQTGTYREPLAIHQQMCSSSAKSEAKVFKTH